MQLFQGLEINNFTDKILFIDLAIKKEIKISKTNSKNENVLVAKHELAVRSKGSQKQRNILTLK